MLDPELLSRRRAADRAPPVTRTRDGYRLRLPHARVHTLLSRLEPQHLRAMVGDLTTDPAPALATLVRRLTPHARRAGWFGRGPVRLPIFVAGRFQFLVRPIAPGDAEILTLRTLPGLDHEVVAAQHASARRGGARVRGARVRIEWSGPFPVAPQGLVLPRRVPRSGVYIAVRPGPIAYVGESGDMRSRWRHRCRIFTELGLTGNDFPQTVAATKVWVGSIQPENALVIANATGASLRARSASAALLRKDVEHVLIRYLRNSGIMCTNRVSIQEIEAAGAGISIVHTGSMPLIRGAPMANVMLPGRARFEVA